jgi:hypothetical protein
MTLGNQFTISAWINPKDVSGDYTILGTSANGCDNWIGINGSYLYALITETMDVNNLGLFGTTALTPNKWYHVCMVVNTNVAKLYLNGSLDYNSGTIGFTIAAWTGNFSVGRRCPDLDQRYFNGNIDSVACYNTVLTDQEILSLYNRTKSRYLR